MKPDNNSRLFHTEQAILQDALADIGNEAYTGNDLLFRYKALTSQYQKLLRLCRKIFHISDSQGLILQQQQNEMQMLLDNAEQGFLTFGPSLKVNRQYSQECVRIFGRKIGGEPIMELLSQGAKISGEQVADKLHKAFILPADEGKEVLKELSGIVTIDDKKVRVDYKKINQADTDSDHMLIMMIMTDITEKLKADAKIHYLSFHDKLTDLYNRSYIDYMTPMLEQADKLSLSLIMIDMNGLKVVNDVFGHIQGDQQLVSLASVLRQACRESDIICRWGGDEFVIFLPNTKQNECIAICERIGRLCREVKHTAIPLSASVGMATKDNLKIGLLEVFNTAENRMYSNKLREGQAIRQGIIDSILLRLQQQCFEEVGHNERIAVLGAEFMNYLGLPANARELDILRPLAMLHDIGKVAIPQNVLGKKGVLTAEEWEIVKKHSEIGYRMAQSISDSALAEIILALHERWDGQGYPYGLQGKNIPWLARVFAIIESYDVITHERPYGAVLNKEEALSEILHVSGQLFEPELADNFIQFMEGK
ncbi:MAG: diguanylate cyclase [Pelosinus sp.]|nr:diguanylate cyclase [Pelosinus sp.]